MPAPFEIIAAPFTAWWAPTGTAFPLIDAAPGAGWTKIGSSGASNYSEEGVTVTHSQNIELFRTLEGTGPVKGFRTEEDLVIAFTLIDMTLEQYRLALNNNTVTTTAPAAGVAGFKAVNIHRGVEVATMALLLRGDVSPEGDGWKTQYQVPVCFENGSPEVVFTKGEPAGLSLSFTAMEDLAAATIAERFGKLIVQHAAPI